MRGIRSVKVDKNIITGLAINYSISKKIRTIIIINSLSWLLSGCGFTLHHPDALSLQFSSLYYSQANSYHPLDLAVKKRLARQLTLLATPNQHAPVLNLTHTCQHQNSGRFISTQTRFNTLSCTATLELSDSQQRPLFSPITLVATREIVLQPNEVYAASLQIDAAQIELQQELLEKIFRVLASPQATKAIQVFYENQS